jgi:hypothetical protein
VPLLCVRVLCVMRDGRNIELLDAGGTGDKEVERERD